MRLELAKRDDVWRCRRRRVLTADKNRHALVGRSSMRRRSTKESSAGSASSERIILRDRSQGQEVIGGTGRRLRFDATLGDEYGLSAAAHKNASVHQPDAREIDVANCRMTGVC